MATTLVHSPAKAPSGALSGLGDRVGRFLSWIRKSEGQDPAGELLRLAETSPHLLSDVGLDAAEGSGGRVWTDGHHRIAVPSPDAATRLLRVGRF